MSMPHKIETWLTGIGIEPEFTKGSKFLSLVIDYGVSEPDEFADLDDATIELLTVGLKMAKRKKFSRAVLALSTENA